jgi:hypothetical protein
VKTSIRLALTSFAVSCITLAAAGTPLPFFAAAPKTAAPAVLLPPGSLDGSVPAASAYLDLPGAHGSFRLQ